MQRSETFHQRTDQASDDAWRNFLIGRSPAMERLADKIRLIGPKRATILITGETGTGKEVTARAIHAASPRAALPMVTVNCTALPESLLEAELFGHVKGAFTGAVQRRIGRFEQAHGSTIFLDEIGDMPLETQAKLLRVLQEKEFQRIGSSETIRVDVRVIAATNANLEERIAAGKFREDLYYRLNVVPLTLPPLRERRQDIPLLTEHFLKKICDQEGLPLRHISDQALDLLRSYSWPGNVRQLENCLEMAIALSGERQILLPSDFVLPRLETRSAPEPPGSPEPPLIPLPEEGLDFEATLGRIEWQILEQALRRTRGNKTQAAGLLRLKRTTLSAKLRSFESRTAEKGSNSQPRAGCATA
ncbi:MAG: sigma-54 dependent transcriptional regulator [Bryobacteraceae bacterium]|nr:sigma-54 dependent transcriptional regulator [Bryobacteraceae bacterium]MDW8378586.1 sigma-54 dependent transcriptional regulator [Bryobacterales bacterium]